MNWLIVWFMKHQSSLRWCHTQKIFRLLVKEGKPGHIHVLINWNLWVFVTFVWKIISRDKSMIKIFFCRSTLVRKMSENHFEIFTSDLESCHVWHRKAAFVLYLSGWNHQMVHGQLSAPAFGLWEWKVFSLIYFCVNDPQHPDSSWAETVLFLCPGTKCKVPLKGSWVSGRFLWWKQGFILWFHPCRAFTVSPGCSRANQKAESDAQRLQRL